MNVKGAIGCNLVPFDLDVTKVSVGLSDPFEHETELREASDLQPLFCVREEEDNLVPLFAVSYNLFAR